MSLPKQVASQLSSALQIPGQVPAYAVGPLSDWAVRNLYLSLSPASILGIHCGLLERAALSPIRTTQHAACDIWRQVLPAMLKRSFSGASPDVLGTALLAHYTSWCPPLLAGVEQMFAALSSLPAGRYQCALSPSTYDAMVMGLVGVPFVLPVLLRASLAACKGFSHDQVDDEGTAGSSSAATAGGPTQPQPNLVQLLRRQHAQYSDMPAYAWMWMDEHSRHLASLEGPPACGMPVDREVLGQGLRLASHAHDILTASPDTVGTLCAQGLY